MTAQEIPSDIKDRLTEREFEVLEQIVGPSCSTNYEAAVALHVSERTIEVHRGRIMKKLAARNVVHLARMVLCHD
jgi:DNA-binding NarL/FixJ family response regulator